jgi:predicted phage terminase large subunit-like protein
MVLMPPGSAKSTYTSVLFPVWWFTQHPSSSIICASHSTQLSEYFSRRVRALITQKQRSLGFTIRDGQKTKSEWSTTRGGDYLSVGVQSAIAGRRADLVVIDDPFKSKADADSLRIRDHVWDWYRSDIITRLRPNGRVVLIMTRWHPDDLGGRLLEHAPEEWKIVRLPALAEANDPLGREPGSALWPEWENEEALTRKRSIIGERAWMALFQQTPLVATGRLFAVQNIVVIDTSTGAENGVRAWDLAATEKSAQNDPDWTVGVKLSRDAVGRFLVSDVVRMRGSPHQVEQTILETARRDGRSTTISIPEDPGQAGKSQTAYLVRQLAGYNVQTSRETGSKATRATPFAAQVEAGNVSVLQAAWTRAFLDELDSFPVGAKDDQVDAVVRAFNTLSAQPKSVVPRSLSLIGR